MGGQKTIRIGVLAANIAATVAPAGAQESVLHTPPSHPITVYVQASDARFDSYLYVKKLKSSGSASDGSDAFFYIPRSNSKAREREMADWRRQFRLIVSAATLADAVQPKISQIKEEFDKADSAAECWAVDKNRERRITITMIGSADAAEMEAELTAASREFLADPRNFTCRYKYRFD
jgi:hypothetical protein